MRLKIGKRSDAIARVLAVVAPPTSTGPVADPVGLADVDPDFGAIDPGSDPLAVAVIVPPFDPATHNQLASVTAVAVPTGQGEPSDANGWMASGFPKATANTSHLQAGGEVAVGIPGVPDGIEVSIQLILAFAN